MKRHPMQESLGLATMLAVALAACGPDIPPPKPLAVQKEAPAVDDTASAEAQEEPATYVYSPVGKRDPFSNPIGSTSGKVVVRGADPTRPLEPLQKYGIDQLTLKFTTTGSSTPMAMVIDGAGVAHPVRIGSWIGKNWGKVSHIGREEITITETIADQQTGRVYPQYIPLRMPKSDAEVRSEQALTNNGESL